MSKIVSRVSQEGGGGSQHSEPKDYGPLMDHTQLHEEKSMELLEGFPPNIAL